MTIFTTAPWMTNIIVPKNGTITVAITDNVLQWEDWPVRELTLKNKEVVGFSDIQTGVYSFNTEFNPQLGWTKKQVEEWLAYDTTGQHPQVYHIRVEVY